MQRKNLDVNRMGGMAILITMVVILQFVATYVRIGAFPLTLVLIPIVVGAALYGPGAGAVLGCSFGAVVLLMTVSGADAAAYILWAAKPGTTALLCLLKGAAAGYAAGLAYSLIAKKNEIAGVFTAAFLCPIVNTGLFLAAMALFYREMLIEWADGSSLLYFSFIGLAGVNFLIELSVNVVLAVAVLRIIRAVRANKRAV
jgi:uncharacterized membrane protein